MCVRSVTCALKPPGATTDSCAVRPRAVSMSTRSRSPPGKKFLQPERWAAHMYKTAMCVFFEEGKCLRGASCRFAHDQSEVQPVRERLSRQAREEYMRTGVPPGSKTAVSKRMSATSQASGSKPSPPLRKLLLKPRPKPGPMAKANARLRWVPKDTSQAGRIEGCVEPS